MSYGDFFIDDDDDDADPVVLPVLLLIGSPLPLPPPPPLPVVAASVDAVPRLNNDGDTCPELAIATDTPKDAGGPLSLSFEFLLFCLLPAISPGSIVRSISAGGIIPVCAPLA